MDAGQDNHIGIGRGGTLRQRQGIPDDVGDAVEDFRRLVVVRQNDGVALAFQTQDGIDLGREDRPFEGRNHALHPLVQAPRALRHLRRELR